MVFEGETCKLYVVLADGTKGMCARPGIPVVKFDGDITGHKCIMGV